MATEIKPPDKGDDAVLRIARTLWAVLKNQKEFANLYSGYFLTLESAVRECMDPGQAGHLGLARDPRFSREWKRRICRKARQEFRNIFATLEMDWEWMEDEMLRNLEELHFEPGPGGEGGEAAPVYQMIIPRGYTLDTVLMELNLEAIRELEKRGTGPLAAPEGEIYGRVNRILEGVLDKHAFAFNQCGKFETCAANRPAPWNGTGQSSPLDRGKAVVLHLWMQDGLNELLDEAVPAILKETGVEDRANRRAAMRLREALRHSLGKYLFENANCFHSAHCKAALRADHWQAGAA